MSPDNRRIAVTGMAINTPLGDTLADHLAGLLEGRSAITRWRTFPVEGILGKVGADLLGYDARGRARAFEGTLPAEMYRKVLGLVGRVPWSTSLSILLAADAWQDAGLAADPPPPEKVATIVAGHNINNNYTFEQRRVFDVEPEFVDGLFALYALDTDHAGCVSEVLSARGPIYTVGGACASGNTALRMAVDELRHHGAQAAVVVGAVLEHSPIDFQGMAIMGAIAHRRFNDEPSRACRPFDTQREGFVPAHGGAVMILEPWDRAVARGASIYAEVLGVDVAADGSHLPQPSMEGQVRLMRKVLSDCGVAPEEVGYVNAHATSTPLGDLTEARAIREVFGDHCQRLKVNATKSMLGHTCWSAAVVETVGAILQMRAGRLHPSINVDEQDPEIDLDVCAQGAVDHSFDLLLKNAFGFGGINSVSLIRRASEGAR